MTGKHSKVPPGLLALSAEAPANRWCCGDPAPACRRVESNMAGGSKEAAQAWDGQDMQLDDTLRIAWEASRIKAVCRPLLVSPLAISSLGAQQSHKQTVFLLECADGVHGLYSGVTGFRGRFQLLGRNDCPMFGDAVFI